ncbi:hypothetical protein, partial [Filibacter tadaridae]|uniref:hypothetical protein n=1 Tax=Filibacter tadaridae TaxID=2483811 RepID=UPI001939BB14
LMLSKNVRLLMVLPVQVLTDIMSLGNLEKGKDAFHVAGHYSGRRKTSFTNMIIVHNYTIEEDRLKGVFSSMYRTSAVPLL